MLCRSREVKSEFQEFKSIFEVETTDQGTTITIIPEKPDKESNTSRSFHDVRRNKHRRSLSKDMKNGRSQEISSESNNTSSNVDVKEPRSNSQDSQGFLEQQ